MGNFSHHVSTKLSKRREEKRSGSNLVSTKKLLFHYYPTCFPFLETKASEKVSNLIQKKSFCADVTKMSPKYQTSACEAFHSVVITFAPKSTAFSYHGMQARYYGNIAIKRPLRPWAIAPQRDYKEVRGSGSKFISKCKCPKNKGFFCRAPSSK